ncbi:MAG: MFS transporter [Syntrophorhabdaceae bacterium]|nr:MFS transporter [Syntrophorhabdaceae bacterium]
MEEKRPILTKGFICLNVIYFLIFSNLAIFFNYYNYLETLPIDPKWFGFLMGLDALIALILRPFVSPFFTERNAPATILWGTGLVFFSLLGYTVAHTLVPMLIIRGIHGVSIVILSSALTAYTVSFIPPERSAQAFGIISVSFLLPYTVVPFAVEFILSCLKRYEFMFIFACILMLPVFPILFYIHKRSNQRSQGLGKEKKDMVSFGDMITNIRDGRVASLLFISVITFVSFSALYYFLKSLAIKIGASDTGYFFTIYSITMIFVRVMAGHFFDKVNKFLLFSLSTVFTGICYILIGRADSMGLLYIYALFFGIGIGVLFPLINGIAFDISDAKMRGVNLNLIIETRDLGFFIGPVISAYIMKHYDLKTLFLFCGIISIISLCIMPFLVKDKNPEK